MVRAWVLWLGIGCGGSRQEEAVALVKSTFEQQNQAGRTATEVLGKGVWYSSAMIDTTCLRGKQWAFQDDKHKNKHSPVYNEQRHYVTSTDKGYCVLIGVDPTLEVTSTEWVAGSKAVTSANMDVAEAKDLDGVYSVSVKMAFKAKAGWSECLDPGATDRMVYVAQRKGGALEIIGDRVDFGQGACPTPAPMGDERKGSKRPVEAAPAAPSMADVKALLQSFDDAIASRDYLKARELLSCYNLFESEKYGSCAVSELLGLSPMPSRGVTWMEPPWSEGVFDSLDELQRIFPDPKDPTMVHVAVAHRKTKAPRSLALQWVDGTWKLVAVVSLKGEGLTTPRFVYDLDLKDRREVFEQRLGGAQVDERGEPYDPDERAKAE